MNDSIDEIDLISIKIIEKNTLNKSVREANERREDLARVLHRVENIYGEFEKPLPFNREFSTLFLGNKKGLNGANIEMVEDVPTLEQMLISHQSREKYLQQVTVFIVGYSKVAQDRLQLMQEVNQFFLNSEDMFDSVITKDVKIQNDETEESLIDKKDSLTMAFDDDDHDYTTSELAESMEQTIDACQSLTNRLGELNNNIINCFTKYAQNKAGNKGKKKLEKTLENAINETNKLNEKLSQTLKIISEKDSRIESLMKQCEAKTKEVQKFKAAAESIKKAALEADGLREQVKERDNRIMKLESELMQTKMKIEEVKTIDAAQRAYAEEMAKEFQEKSMILEKSLENQKIDFEESKRELIRQHSTELKQRQAEYEAKLSLTISTHEQETKQLKSSEFDENAVALQWSEPDNDIDKPLTKSLSSLSKNDKEEKFKHSSRVSSGVNKESSPYIQRGSGQSSAKDIWIFDNAPDIDNDDFWSNIPRNHLLGRFAQYRQMCKVARSNLQDEIESNTHLTNRQIHSLKSQHQAHKHKWDEERENLIEALRKVEEEKNETQTFADIALEEMEKFISFMKSEERDKDSPTELNLLNMLEIAEYIRDFLKKQALFNEPISSMVNALINKCQIFQERTHMSLPKFPTMLDSRRDQTIKIEVIEKNSQTETVIKTVDSYAILDENFDILLEEEKDDNGNGKRDVAISASPSLLKIALGEYKYPNDNVEVQGVTYKDLEVPSNFIDIQDRTGLGLMQHPIVVNYLHSYDHILTFKEHMITILEDLDKTEISDIENLKELKPISIKSKNRIIPQIEDIGKSIERILFKSGELIEKILFPVKKKLSLTTIKREDKSYKGSIIKDKENKTTKTKKNSKVYLNYITGECRNMKMELKAMKHSFILKFNVINNTMLKIRQMIISQPLDIKKEVVEDNSDQQTIQRIDNVSKSKTIADIESISILFTRKNSESNIRRMQEAILQNTINDEIFEEAVEKMADYVEIPAKRLLVLIKKYIQKEYMEKISEYVKGHNRFDADTFKILNKMEICNERKLRRYHDFQEYFRNERILRAQAMIETFDKIQSSSSIFLIRPVLSISAGKKLQEIITTNNMEEETKKLKNECFTNVRRLNKTKLESPLLEISKIRNSDDFNFGNKMWMPDYTLNEQEYNPNAVIESKLFEIDTNRMLLPLNNVSTAYNMMNMTDGQATLPPNIAVRSYVAVAHPTLVDMSISPQPTSSFNRKQTAPDSASKSRLSRDLSKHAPLPPIIPTFKDSDILLIENDN